MIYKTFFGAQGLGGGATRTRGLSLALGLLFVVATAIGFPKGVLAAEVQFYPDIGLSGGAVGPSHISNVSIWGIKIDDSLGNNICTANTIAPYDSDTYFNNGAYQVSDKFGLCGGTISVNDRYKVSAAVAGSAGSPDYSNTIFFLVDKTASGWFAVAQVIDSTERIISYTPVNGSTEPSTSVTLSANVWNESSSFVRFNFQNFDYSGSIPSYTLTLPAVSGDISTSTTVTLPQGYYFGTVQMLRSDLSVVDTSNFTFTVVQSNLNNFSSYASSTAAASSTIPTCIGTSTDSFFSPLLNFGCFLVVPSPASIAQFTSLGDTLKTKIPFVYFYDLQTIVASSSVSAASSTLGTFTLNIGTSTDPFHLSVILFSPATIRYFIPDSTAEALQFILLASLWVGFGWYIYNRVRRLLSEKTK